MAPHALAEQLDKVEAEALIEAQQTANLQALEAWRVKVLGRKGVLADVLKHLPSLSPEERPGIGQRANQLKARCETLYAQRAAQLKTTSAGPALDVTLPGTGTPLGHRHILTQTLDELITVFGELGFQIAEGPETEYEYYNFTALNIPADHPSREGFDTFYLDLPPHPKRGAWVLRSHTSPVQIRVMERTQPPVRVVVPGRVYRPDQVDASHSFMFHQLEGLYVDRGVTFADLKGVLGLCLRRLFGPKTQIRFRPHYFPFTEPSAEVDIGCSVCRGKGCSTCGRKGWLEILGCGMVHPNVFRHVKYDPERYTGFAFGMGIERIAMLRYGIHDIRLFFENDMRFLEQW